MSELNYKLFNQNTIMKKIEYQAPVIKTLTMEFLMQSASDQIQGSGAGTDDITYGGIDNDGMEGDAKSFGNRSVWDD